MQGQSLGKANRQRERAGSPVGKPADLAAFLGNMGLAKYTEMLRENEIDLEAVQLMADSDFQDIGALGGNISPHFPPSIRGGKEGKKTLLLMAPSFAFFEVRADRPSRGVVFYYSSSLLSCRHPCTLVKAQKGICASAALLHSFSPP